LEPTHITTATQEWQPHLPLGHAPVHVDSELDHLTGHMQKMVDEEVHWHAESHMWDDAANGGSRTEKGHHRIKAGAAQVGSE
jgi:hypothetical protein